MIRMRDSMDGLMPSKSSGQLVRYALVGVTRNAGGFLVYLLVTWLGVAPKLAMSVLYVGGVLLSYYLNRKWTFQHGGSSWPALPRYFLTYVIGYVVNLAAFVVFVDCLGYAHQLVMAVMVFLVAGMLFMLQKFWVFKSTRADARSV